MASGYDIRSGGMQTFAFSGSSPAQEKPTAQGASSGANIVGGNSVGGVDNPNPQTDPGATATPFGAFFGSLMEPWVAAKQEQKFNEGFTAAQQGKALTEIDTPNDPITKIFGSTGYQKGAQFYTGQKAVTDWQQMQMADRDRLKRMGTDELARHIGDTSKGALTGDPAADAFIQKGLMEASGPLINTITKDRVAWQQLNAKQSHFEANMSSAGAYQTVVSAQTNLTGVDPNAGGQSAITSARGSFHGLLGQPVGMTDDSYQSNLFSIGSGMLDSGMGHSYQEFKASPEYQRLSPDQMDKLDLKEIRDAPRAQTAALANYQPDLIELDKGIARGHFNAVEAADAYRDINDKVSRDTGFGGSPVFGTMEQVGKAHTVIEMLIAQRNKLDDRLYAASQQKLGWAHEADVERAREAAKTDFAMRVWATGGSVVQGIAGGADKALIEAQASNDWQQGNLGNIVRNYSGGFIPSTVSAAAQSSVQATAGQQYSKEFQATYDKWKTVVAAKPSLALALYGPYHPMMQNYDSMMKGGANPIIAYSKAFGDAAQYGSADIGPDRRKEVEKAMDTTLSIQNSVLPWSAANLGPLGLGVVKQAAWSHVAVSGKNSATPTANLMKEAVEAQTASGQFERYGQFAWRNQAGTKPLGQMLGLQARDATAVFTQVYNKHAVGIGAAANTDPTSLIRYDNNGHPAMIAEIVNKAGATKRIAITYEELGMAAHDYVSSRVSTTHPLKASDTSVHGGMPAMR